MRFKKKVVIAIIIVLVVAFIISVATLDDRRWNDGKCPDCEETWELIKEIPSRHGNGAAEIWRCPHCHKTITLGASKEILGWIYIALDVAISIGIYQVYKTINNKRRKKMKNTKKEFVKGIAATYAAKIIATLAGTASVAMALFGISLIDPNATFVANIAVGVGCGIAAIICGKIAVCYAKRAIKLEKKY